MAGPLRAGVAVLERAVAYCLGSLALVTPARLTAPTPCPGWSLRDLLDHLIDSMSALEEAAAGEVMPTGPAGASDVLSQARDGAVRLLGAWAQTGGAAVRIEHARLTAPVVAGVGSIELTVHGWDVARSCVAQRPIPADLADELLDLAVVLIRAPDRPGRFARPLPARSDAPADQLLAFLGRAP
jgi:uncharacterized protein (TIGR03086 family)